jgi:hypothetical protein
MTVRTSFDINQNIKSRLNLISKKRNINESQLINVFFTKIFEIWEDEFLDNSSVEMWFISYDNLTGNQKNKIKEIEKKDRSEFINI